MKKIFYTLLVVFTCFIGLNKVSAVNIDTYDEKPNSAYVYLSGNPWLANPYQTTLKGLNYWVVEDPNRVESMRFTYNIYPSNNTYDVTFQVFGADTRGVTPYIGNNSCQTFASGVSTNSNSVDYDSKLSNYYNVYCYNIPGGTKLDISFNIDWAIEAGLHRIGVGRFYFTDSLTNITSELSGVNNNINTQSDSIKSSISRENEETRDTISRENEETRNTITNDDVDESTSEATEFFEGFDTDTHGLTSIITAPLELIGNIAGSTCSPLPLQVPFVNKTMSLPCMSTIYKKHFGSFLTVYQTITFGIVAYWVCVRIFALVKDFKNPEHDEIEVMDL